MTEITPRYPLIDSAAEQLRAASGLPLADITDQAARSGRLSMADLQISADALRAQAAVAWQAGYGQLAANLVRAAELTAVPNADVLHMYDLLRPGRATRAQLLDLAGRLERDFQAAECARLVREAAQVYAERGLSRPAP
jgi:propanediol dehydratase small subunit